MGLIPAAFAIPPLLSLVALLKFSPAARDYLQDPRLPGSAAWRCSSLR